MRLMPLRHVSAVLLRSEFVFLPVHWISRSVFCSSDGHCPICPIQTPKWRGFVCGVVGSPPFEILLFDVPVELAQSLMDQCDGSDVEICDALVKLGRDAFGGFRVDGVRTGDVPTAMEVPLVRPCDVVRAALALQRVPCDDVVDSPIGWDVYLSASSAVRRSACVIARDLLPQVL